MMASNVFLRDDDDGLTFLRLSTVRPVMFTLDFPFVTKVEKTSHYTHYEQSGFP